MDYKDKIWLINQYVIQCRTMKEIAEDCKVIPKTIYYWIKKFNIQ